MGLSVLMGVHGKETPSYFQKAIFSIWDEQTQKPDQIVLVKDGPVGAELEVLILWWQNKLGETLTIVELVKNQGLGAALHVGLQACKYELVARMDSDDISMPERFLNQAAFFSENSSVDILGCWVDEIDFSGRIIGSRKVPLDHDSIISSLWACPLIHPTVMMRRSRILEVGNYSVALPRRQDYELWFRCAERGLGFHNLPEKLLQYRFGKRTHKRQSAKIAWKQGVIGFKGSGRIRTPMYYRFLCFVPFVRSLLPAGVQHFVYKGLSRFDPRNR